MAVDAVTSATDTELNTWVSFVGQALGRLIAAAFSVVRAAWEDTRQTVRQGFVTWLEVQPHEVLAPAAETAPDNSAIIYL